jgi:hypothetical protein
MTGSSDYRNAYVAAQRELAELLVQQENLEKRIVTVRQSIQTLATLCESEHVTIEPSREASYLLETSPLADEIRSVLSALYPLWLRPVEIKKHLERLGHDLSKYQNPLATIHMIVRRMTESGEVLETEPPDGKKSYSRPPTSAKVEEFWNNLGLGESVAESLRATKAPRKTFGQRIAEGGKK